jgi:serine/threonine protein kinase
MIRGHMEEIDLNPSYQEPIKNEEPKSLGQKESNLIKKAIQDVINTQDVIHKPTSLTNRNVIKPAPDIGKINQLAKEKLSIKGREFSNPSVGVSEGEISHYYRGILANFEREWEGEKEHLIERSGKEIGLTAKKLEKVIHIALTTQLETTREGGSLIKIGKEEKKTNQQFIAKLEGKTFHLIRYDNKEKLGGGAFGKVFRVFQINLEYKEKAFKEARIENPFSFEEVDTLDSELNAQHQEEMIKSNKEAKEQLQNEYKILRIVNENGPVWGIQGAPHLLIHIAPKTAKEPFIYGFVGPKYALNYDKFLRKNVQSSPFTDKLLHCHQLLYALKKLSEKNIFHGDIKPENIFVSIDPQSKKIFVHLGDFGGARQGIPATEETPFTNEYLPLGDLKKRTELIAAGDKNKELLELDEKQDIYAMGATLYRTLTGRNPYPISNTNYPDHSKGLPNQSVQQLKDATSSLPGFADLLIQMIDPVYSKRPTRQEAFNSFVMILKNHGQNPTILVLIHFIQKQVPDGI